MADHRGLVPGGSALPVAGGPRPKGNCRCDTRQYCTPKEGTEAEMIFGVGK